MSEDLEKRIEKLEKRIEKLENKPCMKIERLFSPRQMELSEYLKERSKCLEKEEDE